MEVIDDIRLGKMKQGLGNGGLKIGAGEWEIWNRGLGETGGFIVVAPRRFSRDRKFALLFP